MSAPEDQAIARLVAYAEGELSEAERMRFELELSEDPGLLAQLESYTRMLELQGHFPARSAGRRPRLASGSWRWLAAAVLLVAGGALLWRVAWHGAEPRQPALLARVELDLAHSREDLFATVRSGGGADLYVGVRSSGTVFVRLLSLDDRGRATSLGLDPQGHRSLQADAGDQKLGPYERSWSSPDGEVRRRAFVVLLTAAQVDEGSVEAALADAPSTPHELAQHVMNRLGGEAHALEIAD